MNEFDGIVRQGAPLHLIYIGRLTESCGFFYFSGVFAIHRCGHHIAAQESLVLMVLFHVINQC
jgi:hypothetical protein